MSTAYGILGRTHTTRQPVSFGRLSRLRATMIVHRIRCAKCQDKLACRAGARLALNLDAAEAKAGA